MEKANRPLAESQIIVGGGGGGGQGFVKSLILSQQSCLALAETAAMEERWRVDLMHLERCECYARRRASR